MLDKVLVGVGELAVGFGDGERLGVAVDGRGEVGRIHRGQRLTLPTPALSLAEPIVLREMSSASQSPR